MVSTYDVKKWPKSNLFWIRKCAFNWTYFHLFFFHGIYNYNILYSQIYSNYGVTPETDSDCEVIIHLYILFGIRQTLRLLDGVFSFVLYDCRCGTEDPKVFVARDPFGVRPLFVFERDSINDNLVNHIDNKNITRENIMGFASEMKALHPFLCDGTPLVWNNSYTELHNMSKTNYSVVRPYTIKQFPPSFTFRNVDPSPLT